MNESNSPSPDEQQEPEAQIDPALLEAALQRFRSEQNLVGAVIAGLVAAVLSAVLWAVITATTGYQIGFMAIGVGFVVGIAMRTVGKGIDKSFGIAGALLALFGCLLGNLLTVCYFVSVSEEMPLLDVLTQLNPAVVADMLMVTFSPMDLVFYGIAVYEGYRLPYRQITEEELIAEMRGSDASVPT